MKAKKIFLFLFITMLLFPVFAQQKKDVVLVVDTSSSMFSYYNEVGAYLSGPFLAENVRTGDTLHIISFGSKPRFEIARQIWGEGDIATASTRIWLLYPLEPGSDPAAAINYAEQYVRSIQGGQQKKVFIVSDSDLSAQVNAAEGRFRPNAELQFIRAGSRMGQGQPGIAARQPETGTGGTGTRVPATETRDPGTGVTGPGTPGIGVTGIGEPGIGIRDPEDPGTPGIGVTIPGEQGTGDLGTEEPGTGITGIVDSGSTGTGSGTETTGDESTGTGTAQTGSTGFSFSNIPLPFLIGGALLLLLLLILLIFRIKNLQSSPKKVMAEIRSEGAASSRDADLLNSFASRQAEAALQGPNRRYLYRDTSNLFFTKPPMLNIFVEEQNTAIGRRNIHSLKRGASYSVGGGNSDFLIFLVSFPAGLGRLYFDGTNCTFTPLKSEYFPDIGSTPVTECIGKPIRLLSKKNYEVFFHFEPYRDPLIEMNQLLNSIKVPEPPAVPE